MDTFTDGPAGIFSQKAESAFLVGIQSPGMSEIEARKNLAELEQLVDTLGMEVQDSMLVRLRELKPALLVGSGKAEEISGSAAALEVDCIIFDDELSPSQQRNWETLSKCCVIDRHEVILDIFAEHATTREAVLQVGLARAQYSLPRLTRAWTHLSRQRGGRRGTRGAGEMQLESDRRIVLEKIHRFKKELAALHEQRATRRKRRQSVPVPSAAIVGYTNAGKSSLLNRLTGAHAGVENKLFATLDPTTRVLSIRNGQDMLLTDTVGFIRKLPHDLVDAFKSTLEETTLSDFLINVLDGSDSEVERHDETTREVLASLGLQEKPIVRVLNKSDLVHDPERRAELSTTFPDAHFVSARTGEGIDPLIQQLKRFEYDSAPTQTFILPNSRHDLAALIHRTGRILSKEYVDDSIVLMAQVPPKTAGKLESYRA